MKLGPEAVDPILAACQAGAAEAAACLSRAFDTEVALAVNSGALEYDPKTPPAGWNGPGVVFVSCSAVGIAAFVLPASASWLPAWCQQPDATGASRLLTLAQELGASLMPAEFFPERSGAQWSDNLAGTLAACGVLPGASRISLVAAHGEQQAELSLIWPLADPEALNAPAAQQATSPTPAAPWRPTLEEADLEAALPQLPVYSRSLLRILTPVRVTLAQRRMPVRQILELAPGSLIQFAKSCGEPLELEVGGRRVAQGEAVKVGEKFGLRITAMSLPGERFQPIAPPARPSKSA